MEVDTDSIRDYVYVLTMRLKSLIMPIMKPQFIVTQQMVDYAKFAKKKAREALEKAILIIIAGSAFIGFAYWALQRMVYR